MVGQETVDAILDLAEADDLGNLPPEGHIPALRKKIQEMQVTQPPISNKTVLDGKEVMDVLGLGQGPEVGKVLKWLTEMEDDYAARGETMSKDEAIRLIRKQFG